MQTPCEHWLGKLANLNVARTGPRGIAPHKPLMLLTVIDLIESGDIPDGWVRYDVRLVSRFRDYWELVQDRQRNSPDIPMPFNALGGERDQIWQCFTTDGQPSKSKLTTRLCHLDPDLFACLQDADFRREARRTLVGIYFTATEQVMLCARLGLPAPKTEAIAALRADAAAFKASQKKGRDSRFKSDVLGGYYFSLDKNEVDHLARQRFGKGVKQLSKLEASGLIDELLETYGGSGRPAGNNNRRNGSAYRGGVNGARKEAA